MRCCRGRGFYREGIGAEEARGYHSVVAGEGGDCGSRFGSTAQSGRDEVGGAVVGGGVDFAHGREAAIAGCEHVSLAGEEAAGDIYFCEPIELLEEECLAGSDAAGSDGFDEEQAAAFLNVDVRALACAASAVGDEDLGAKLQPCAAADVELLAEPRGFFAGAGAEDAAGARARDDCAGAGAGRDGE